MWRYNIKLENIFQLKDRIIRLIKLFILYKLRTSQNTQSCWNFAEKIQFIYTLYRFVKKAILCLPENGYETII